MRRKTKTAPVRSEWHLKVDWFDDDRRPASPGAPLATLTWRLPNGRFATFETKSKRLLDAVGVSLEQLLVHDEHLALPTTIRVDTPEIAEVMKMAWREVDVVLVPPATTEASPRSALTLH